MRSLTEKGERKIDSFGSLAKFTDDREQKYQQLETVHLSKGQKLNRLKELSKMYALYAPIQATYKESQSLKGLAKTKYNREHKDKLKRVILHDLEHGKQGKSRKSDEK